MNPEELHNIYRTESEFWWYRGMRSITDAMLDPILKKRGGIGLDAGCGTGFNALRLQERYGFRMVGVDVTPVAIRYCRSLGLESSLVSSVMELPFGENSFDFICSFDVLAMLRPGDDQRALTEFARVLRPGGFLMVRVAAFEALRSQHSIWIIEHQRYRERKMVQMLDPLKLQIVRSTYANSILSPIALFKFRVIEPLLRSKPESGVTNAASGPMNWFGTSILKTEAALLRLGFRFFFGQSWMAVIQKSN